MSGRVAKSLRSQQRKRREQLKRLLEKMRGAPSANSFKSTNTNTRNINCYSHTDCLDKNVNHLNSGLASSQTNINIEDENELYIDMSQETIVPIGQEIRSWVLKHNVNHSCLRDLLKIIHGHNIPCDLPLDPRTLMETTRLVNVQQASGGSFVYFGIMSGVTDRFLAGLRPLSQFSSPIHIKLQNQVPHPLLSVRIGVDGIPVSKSNNKQFWPVLGVLDQSQCQTPFVIALYYGNSKPTDQQFLQPFVQECKELEENCIVAGKPFSFRISAILADAPARSFLKNCKAHNAYYGCERCNEEGTWSGRVIYHDSNCNPRSDLSFEEMIDEDHHNGETILKCISIGLVSQVPLDYMHLVCLGVTRKLLRMWVKGKLPHRLPSRDVLLISKRLLRLRPFFPSSFQRKPRSLVEIDHFKATEFRTFLLYTGVVALKGIIDRKQYKCFLLFHCAIFILLSSNASEPEWNSLAKSYLCKFVENCCALYGREFLIYNVHNLLHINIDAVNYGNLDSISTFPFENFMQKIKHMLHSHNFKLQQVAKRVLEMQSLEREDKEPDKNNSLWFEHACKIGDNCFLHKSGDILVLTNLLTKCKNENVRFEAQKYIIRSKLDEYPMDSSLLGIFVVEKLSDKFTIVINASDIVCTYFRMYLSDKVVCIPLLHTIK